MPRTRSLAWAELKIGLISVFALVIAATLIFMLSGEAGFFWQRYTLKAQFTNVAGLKPGAPVRVAGVEVGSVTGVIFAGAKVEVVMELSKAMQPRVTTESVAAIGSVSVLGEGAVDITASTTGQPIPEWGYVRSGRGASSISDVATEASEGLQQATQLLKDVRQGKGTVGRLVTDETLYRDLQGLVAAAEEVTTNLTRGRGTVGKLMNDPAAYRSLQASLENLNAITRRIRAGEGSLGRLVNDDAFAKSVTSATSNVDSLAGKMNRGEGTAGRLVNDPALYNRLNSLADRLDQVATRLNQGQGTAGQLLQDKALYDNMNSAVAELRNLISDIRKDPRKYLQVKVSIF